MQKLLPIICLALFSIFISCGTSKSVGKNNIENADTSSCQFEATLLDFTGNDNCQFLFQLADGTKLLPGEMPEVDFPFYDQKKVILGYLEYSGDNTKTISACMMEDKIVRITCLEEIKGEEPMQMEDCESVKNVFKVDWMREVVDELKPQKIFEYDYEIGFLYLFKKREISHLYDCLGNKMCDTQDGGDCASLISTLGEAKLIQVLKN